MRETTPDEARYRIDDLASRPARSAGVLCEGDAVEVFVRSVQIWSPGFVVSRVEQTGIWVRRASDSSELPVPFGREQIQRVR